MRKIEFYAHTILLTVLLLSLISFGKGAIIFLLIAQFFVGIYQVMISFVTTLRISGYSSNTKKLIYFYWIICAVYVVVFVLLLNLNMKQNAFHNYLVGAWFIALYYYYIIYNLAFPNYTKSHLDI